VESYSNNERWFIVRYARGSGGKFLLNCFTQYDKLSSWVEGHTKQQRIDSYVSTFPNDTNIPWVKDEIVSPYNLDFFSRTFSRGHNLSLYEFDKAVTTSANQKFFDDWNNNKIISEISLSQEIPNFWKYAKNITIKVDDIELYKSLLFSKPFYIEGNTLTSTCDSPLGESKCTTHKKFAEKFDNEWFWENPDFDYIFDNYVVKQEWYKPVIEFNKQSDNFINLTDLFDVKKVFSFVDSYSDFFEEKIPYENIEKLHSQWIDITQKFIDIYENTRLRKSI